MGQATRTTDAVWSIQPADAAMHPEFTHIDLQVLQLKTQNYEHAYMFRPII